MALVWATLGEHRRIGCDVVREALSARIDEEREPVSSRRVDTHLATCVQCQRWYADVVDHATRLGNLAVAARLRRPRRQGTASRPNAWSAVAGPRVFASARWCLALVGIVSVVLTALQVLETAAGHGAPVEGHLLGESTAGSLGIGVAMIIAAIRPATAACLTGLLATYSAVMTIYVIAGVADGAVTAARELAHLPAPLGAVLALLVWRGARRPGPAPQPPASLEPSAVDGPHEVSGPPRRHHRSRGGSAA